MGFKLPNCRIPELPNRRIVKREKTFFYVLAGVVGRIGIRSCNVKDKRTKPDTQHKNFPGFPLIYILTTFIHLDIRLTVKMKFAALLLFAAVFVCVSCQEENAESNVARIARQNEGSSGSPGGQSGSPGGTTGGPTDNKGSSDSHTESSGAISINIHPEYFVMICVYVCVYLGM